MKASILIVFYLLKDIWHRWLENPGPFLARFSVACLLALLLYAMALVFFYSEFLLRDRIDTIGLHNIYIQRSVAGESSRNPLDLLGPQLEPLSAYGSLFRLQRIHQQVEPDLLPGATLYLYEDASVLPLANLLGDGFEEQAAVLLTDALPAGLPVAVRLPTFDLEVRSVRAAEGGIAPLDSRNNLLLPASGYGWLGDNGYSEVITFRGDSQRIDDFAGLVAAVEAVVFAGGDEGGAVQSTLGLLDQLRELQQRQGIWARWLGLAAGGIVALVYGAITILEYRQNEFIAALIRSFGVSGLLVLLRYLFEGCIMVAAAGVVAAWGLSVAIPALTGLMDVPVATAPALQAFLWSAEGVGQTLPWLVIGGLLSVLPVLFALRKPVGRILG